MKSISFRLINLIATISLLFFTLSAHSAETSNLTPLSQRIYKDIEDIIVDNQLSVTSKIEKLEKKLKVSKDYIAANEFVILFRKAEPTLVLDSENPEVALWQIIFLMSQFTNAEVWVFSETRENVTSRIISLKNTALKNLANSKSPNSNTKNQLEGVVNMFLASELSGQGRFEEADKSFDELFKNIEGTALFPEVKFVCSQIKLKSLLARGDLKSALELSNDLDSQFDLMVDFIHKSEHPEFGNRNITMLSSSFQMDLFLGRNDEVIKKTSKILSLIPLEEGNLKLMHDKAQLLRNLATAYKRTGNENQANKFNEQADDLEDKSGYSDFTVLFKKFSQAIKLKDYELASTIVLKEEIFFKQAYPFENEYNKNIFNKLIAEKLAYIQSEIIEARKPAEDCKTKECLNTQQKILELNQEIESSNDQIAKTFLPAYEDLLESWKSLAIEEKRIGREEVFMSKLAPIFEEIYFLGFQEGWQTMSGELEQLNTLHTFYEINNKEYAAYFARSYINKLQKIRSELRLVNDSDLHVFTEAQSDTLKNFSSTFFDIGDVDSALLCLKIIKENEFYDFVKRGTLSEQFFTLLPATQFEDDYNQKIEMLSNEIRNLKSAQHKELSKSEYELISGVIQKKQKELASMRDNFRQKVSSRLKDHLPLSQKATKIKPLANEAIIQIFLTEKSVQTYLVTNGGVKHFSTEVDRGSIHKLILEINLMLSKRLLISKEKVANLSEALISKPLNAIANKEIKKIRILSDSYLNLIPTSLLVFNGKEIGEKYIIEHIGLGDTKSDLTPTNDSLDIFGASKGNKDFSKLPGVVVEVGELMTLPISNKIRNRNVYIDDDFTKTSLIESFKKGTAFVHIATHFQIKGNATALSKLLLGDGNVISLEELRSQIPKIKSDLVTLSACESGNLIPSSRGKTFDGLSNLFQFNGAKSVISTSWDVSDEATSIFMGIFYSILLNNNLSPSEALFFTQNVFRIGSISVLPREILFKQSLNQNLIEHVAKYSHPYYWAAFSISTLN
jgi:CHAT domain-containing protein